MKILAIILIAAIVITLIVTTSIYFDNKDAKGILHISIITTAISFIYKIVKGGK